jgi:hypothetical protein
MVFKQIINFLNRSYRKKMNKDSLSLASVLAGQNLSFAEWLRMVHDSRRLYVDLDELSINRLKQSFPDQVAQTLHDADEIMSHSFRLLGSDKFTPMDQQRENQQGAYKKIDWYWDPVRNLHFPRGISHKDWDLYAMRPENADIKLPWELARCQHFPTLGQAYRLSDDRRYCFELLNQMVDFTEANPVGYGIHWTCTMDVAIRAANWALGLSLIRSCPGVPIEAWQKIYQGLFEHGCFIFENFENTYEVTSNHYLSNIVGLFLLSALFSDLPQGKNWQAFCRKSLETEIDLQILDDGADFESSVHYHRLVLELFLGAARQGEFRKQPFSDNYHRILWKMCHFHVSLLYPDGRMPVVGDADDGRLHIFSNYGNWNPQSGRHVLAPATMFLGESSWLAPLDSHDLWEAAWWGFDVGKHKGVIPDQRNFSAFFPDAGIAVYQDAGTYLLATNSIVGTKGFGNHKHNDQLSFELHLKGIPLVVDPGSYVYTSDPEARNLFRSTSYHNTLRIDGQEQNKMNPEWLFRLFETARATHLFFRENDVFVEYGGQHMGYEQLSSPVVHKRAYRFYKKQGILIILDFLDGEGAHDLCWHFHLDPLVRVGDSVHGNIFLSGQGNPFTLRFDPELSVQINEAFFSPSYGIRVPCHAIDLNAYIDLCSQKSWVFTLSSSSDAEKDSFSELISRSASELLNCLNV